MSLGWLKHCCHVFTCITFITLSISIGYLTQKEASDKKDELGPHLKKPARPAYEQYGLFLTLLLYLVQIMPLLSLPQVIFNFLGLTLYGAFPGKTKVKRYPLKSVDLPHLCFRVVTRGNYQELVSRNVTRNCLTCLESGLSNFSIEVVTDKEIPLNCTDERVRQIVVPDNYRTSTGALYKARALTYANEPHINQLKTGDYIVHLDEETLITKNVINGIINFALDGTHAFGQGLITYANQEIVNWVTTLADSFRVADDMGKLRFQFYAFHRPLYGFKGSFVVSKYEAEKDVSYDHGPDGSIAEDCYFAMMAYKKGYTFDFIQGEMWEKSPFSVQDLIRQRKRWIQGIWLVVHSSEIPWTKKFFLAMSFYAWLTLPISTLSFLILYIFPLQTPVWISCIGSFCFAISIYMYIFGVLKSFDLKRTGLSMLFVYLVGAVFTLPLNIAIENVAVIWGLVGSKHNFYIVEKDIDRKVVIEV